MRRFAASILLGSIFSSSSATAQPAPSTTGAIHCEHCALSGQKPEAPFFPATADVVPRVEPVFMPGELMGRGGEEISVRVLFIARVLGTSPLRLETLDSRAQQVNRRMTVVLDDIHGGKDPGTCGMSLGPALAVAAEVQTLLPSLRFNDLVSGEWMLQRDAKSPQSSLDGRPVVSGLRKLSPPASWFHPVPATPNCQNRSGRLIVYTDPAGGLLTVYNDGATQYSSQYGQVFAREHLSAEELKDLLGAFAAAGTDTLTAASDDLARMSGSRLPLAAARYQTVRTDSPGDRATEPAEGPRAVERATGSEDWRRTRDSAGRGSRRSGDRDGAPHEPEADHAGRRTP